jgi:hypothetical protein
MTVAAMAYDALTPAARQRVSILLKANPDYERWVAGISPSDRDRVAFVVAATWADSIKHAPGYISDDVLGPDAARNSGYTDKLQHRYWHYINIPFSPDGTPIKQPEAPNLKTQIAAFRAVLASPSASDALKSYDLVWLLHLVGDAHQPLHAVSRFDRDQPNGDRGGNLVELCVAPCRHDLHSFWDDALGKVSDPMVAIERASKLPKATPALAGVSNEGVWLDESFRIAKVSVYVSPVGIGPGPFALDQRYEAAAGRIAEDRVALAGARLANLINHDLVLTEGPRRTEPAMARGAQATEPTVMFNTLSRKYHDPTCVWAMRCTRHCVAVPLSEAKRRGGVPCKACGGGRSSLRGAATD